MTVKAARLNYVELPVADAAVSGAFFEAAFGWTMTAFGPDYSGTTTGDVDLGLQADSAEFVTAPLAVIHVDDLEASLAAVKAAGGRSPAISSLSPAVGASTFVNRRLSPSHTELTHIADAA